MKNLKINHVAVIILTVLYQLVAMIWYGAFAQPWMSLNNLTEAEVGDPSPIPYIVAVIAALITNYVFAAFFKRMKVMKIGDGIKIALLVWLAFYFAEFFTVNMFSMRPVALSFVDGGKTLINFLLTGIILAAWVKYDTESEEPD